MSPTPATNDLPNGAVTHGREVRVYFLGGLTGQSASTYDASIAFAQFRKRISRPNPTGPVSDPISLIFLGGTPPEIINSVVSRIAIIVRHLVGCGRSLANKCSSHALMDGTIFPLPINEQANVVVTPLANAGPERSALHCNTFPSGSHYSTLTAGGVVRSERYNFPNFWRMSVVSHGVSPHVIGQGRALLTQRFRPDFSSRFMVRSQAGALCLA